MTLVRPALLLLRLLLLVLLLLVAALRALLLAVGALWRLLLARRRLVAVALPALGCHGAPVVVVVTAGCMADGESRAEQQDRANCGACDCEDGA